MASIFKDVKREDGKVLYERPILVEIGPGNNQINSHFPCRKYSAAHGSWPDDGLSVLRKMKDASAVVVSFGVIDNLILNPHREVNLRYIEELVKEIMRVMNPFSIIIGLNAETYMGEPDIAVNPKSKYDYYGFGGVYIQSPIKCAEVKIER